ncbi:hypothetical protein Taro_056898 [Colocasia esculenta]|uniref:Cystatin domain-containing protein n=1 Tax=Colocasia esculenta TaxID=4460 RepID=A0A843XUM4_COLES|nr:hypothetical protein [Colocasia esculenta]
MATQPTLVLRLVLLLSVAALVSHRAMARVGSYKPIHDVGNPYVQEIAKFAVAEHNKQTGKALLVYVQVVSGEQQVVAGINYKLVVEVADAGAKKYFEAVVFDNKWGKLRKLVYFVPYVSKQSRLS